MLLRLFVFSSFLPSISVFYTHTHTTHTAQVPLSWWQTVSSWLKNFTPMWRSVGIGLRQGLREALRQYSAWRYKHSMYVHLLFLLPVLPPHSLWHHGGSFQQRSWTFGVGQTLELSQSVVLGYRVMLICRAAPLWLHINGNTNFRGRLRGHSGEPNRKEDLMGTHDFPLKPLISRFSPMWKTGQIYNHVIFLDVSNWEFFSWQHANMVNTVGLFLLFSNEFTAWLLNFSFGLLSDITRYNQQKLFTVLVWEERAFNIQLSESG